MQAVDNTGNRPSAGAELPNNPVNKRLTDINTLLGLHYLTHRLNCMDSRFEKVTELILRIIDLKFKEFKEELMESFLHEKYGIIENKLSNITERIIPCSDRHFY